MNAPKLNKFQRMAVYCSGHQVRMVEGILRFEKVEGFDFDPIKASLDHQCGRIGTQQLMSMYCKTGTSLQSFIDRFSSDLRAAEKVLRTLPEWKKI